MMRSDRVNGHVVDLAGSLAIASHGLFTTGVSTDLNGKCFTSLGNKEPRQLTFASNLPQFWG